MAEQELKEKLRFQIELLSHDPRFQNIDWSQLRVALENILSSKISTTIAELLQKKEELIKELQESNQKLRAKLNQVSFRNNPERDKKILELYGQGLSRKRIAKELGMSPWGISKALRRLRANRETPAT